jgi:CubicO group peptidase (beta-lactamase class C family)
MDLVGELVEAVLGGSTLPGMSVAVTNRDGLVAEAGFGLADIARNEPVTTGTRFEIGSIGKSFTAVALLQLVEDGRLDLSAPVTEYLAWFDAGPGPEITPHQLLTHTAGLIEGSDLSADSRFDVWALRREARADPGRYHYSNVGFRVLGYVLEELTGRPYPDAIRERILEPLGMADADAAITHETRRRLAVGYDSWYDDRPQRRDDPLAPATWLETDTGDGSIAASAPDLAAFARLLLNRGNPILTDPSFELLTQRAVEADDEGAWYGYGLTTRIVEGRTFVGHGGSMPGFGSTMITDPAAGLAAVVLVNQPDERSLARRVALHALDVHRAAASGRELPEPPGYDPYRPETAAEDYAGRYEGLVGELVLEADGETLVLVRDGARLPLEPRAGDRFVIPYDDFPLFCLVFRREGDAVVEAWHGADRYVRAGASVPPLGELTGEWGAYPGHYRASNPWLSNFRVVPRGERLDLVYPWGSEQPLNGLGDGVFRVGKEEWSPERLRFDAIAGGHALCANFSGCDYYRVSTR